MPDTPGMEHEHDEIIDDDGDDSPMPSEVKQNRRARFRPSLSPKMRRWLSDTTRVHARLCAIVRLFNSPQKADGNSKNCGQYVDRLAREDKTLLFDALNKAAVEIDAIREAVSAEMAKAAPTSAKPGSHEKVAEMARRCQRGEWLFIDGDGEPSGSSSAGVT